MSAEFIEEDPLEADERRYAGARATAIEYIEEEGDAPPRGPFAWLRTQLGLQRTLMAAVRTAVSLIGFGFTVAQFFQRLRGNVLADVGRLGPEAPRNLGLILIGAGVITLATFTWQYHMANAYLRGDPYKSIAGIRERRILTPAYFTSFVVMLIGVAAFVAVYARF